MNNIKEVRFVLENCESIIIPYECFQEFEFTTDEYDPKSIRTLKCTIEDNGKMKYSSTWSGNKTSPIQRLAKRNDICYMDLVYNDRSEENIVYWGDDDPNNNMNQESQLEDYKTIHITIEPYIQKYSISDLFDFTNGTQFKGSDDEIYTVNGNEDRYIECDNLRLYLSEKYFSMEFVKI